MGFVNGNFVPDDLMNLRGDALETAMGERGLGRMRNPLRAGGDTLSDIGGQSDADQLDAASNRRVDTISEGRNLPEGSEAVNPYFDRAKALAPGVVTGGVNAFGTRGVGTTPTEGARVDSRGVSSTTDVSTEEREAQRAASIFHKEQQMVEREREKETEQQNALSNKARVAVMAEGGTEAHREGVANVLSGKVDSDSIGLAIDFLRGDGKDDTASGEIVRRIENTLGTLSEATIREALDSVSSGQTTLQGKRIAEQTVAALVSANNTIRDATEAATLELSGLAINTREEYEAAVEKAVANQGDDPLLDIVKERLLTSVPKGIAKAEFARAQKDIDRTAEEAREDAKQDESIAATLTQRFVDEGKSDTDAASMAEQAKDENSPLHAQWLEEKRKFSAVGKASAKKQSDAADTRARESRTDLTKKADIDRAIASGTLSEGSAKGYTAFGDIKMPADATMSAISDPEKRNAIRNIDGYLDDGISPENALTAAIDDGRKAGQMSTDESSTATLRAIIATAYRKSTDDRVNTESARLAQQEDKAQEESNKTFADNQKPMPDVIASAVDVALKADADGILSKSQLKGIAQKLTLEEMSVKQGINSEEYKSNEEAVKRFFADDESTQSRFGPIHDAAARRLQEVQADYEGRRHAIATREEDEKIEKEDRAIEIGRVVEEDAARGVVTVPYLDEKGADVYARFDDDTPGIQAAEQFKDAGDQGRRDILAWQTDRREVKTDAQGAINQLERGFVIKKIAYKVIGKEAFASEAKWGKAKTEQDWDEFQGYIDREYGGHPDVLSEAQEAFNESKNVWNQDVVKRVLKWSDDKDGEISEPEAQAMVEEMNNASEDWAKNYHLKGKEDTRALMESLGFTLSSSDADRDTGLSGKKRELAPDPALPQYDTMDDVEKANLPKGEHKVLIGGELKTIRVS